MSHRQDATAKLQSIPAPKRSEIWRRTILGGLSCILGIAMLVPAALVAVQEGAFSMMLVVWAAFSLGLFGFGAHLVSSQYSGTAGLWVVGLLKDVLAAVRRNGR